MIELIHTDDLIEELLKRHDHAVFMGIKVRGNKDEDDIRSVRRWIGNTYTCSGLCSSLNRAILNDYGDREEPIGKDDM